MNTTVDLLLETPMYNDICTNDSNYSLVGYYGSCITGPHNLIGSGTIRKCDFVGVGIVLLEKLCQCESRLLDIVCSSFLQCNS